MTFGDRVELWMARHQHALFWVAVLIMAGVLILDALWR